MDYEFNYSLSELGIRELKFVFHLRIIIYCDEIMSIREWTDLIAQICFHLLMLPSVLHFHMFHFLKFLVVLINSIRSLLLIVKYTYCF